MLFPLCNSYDFSGHPPLVKQETRRSFSADVPLEKIYFEQSHHERDIGMGRDTDVVSVSSKMKSEGTCLSRRRIRDGTIDQEGGLTLIAGNTRGTRAVPARNDRRNETGVIYRLSAVASSR